MQENSKTKTKRYYEPHCTGIVDVTEWRVDEKGHHHLVKIGEKSLDDEIQLYKDMCDIKILVDRLNAGDPAVIHQLSQPMKYGDVNDYPEEYHPVAGAMALHQLYENQYSDKFATYDEFEKFFVNLTDAMVADMAKPKEQPKESEGKVNEQQS